MRYFFVVLILIMTVAAPALQPARAEKKTLEVRNVAFEGNTVYDGGQLLKLMACRPGGLFHSNEFRQQLFDDDLQNILNFYHDNGYLHAAILRLTGHGGFSG